MIKKILLTVLAVLLIIQFIRPQKNVHAGISRNDITTSYPVPDNIKNILQRSCYDCHSNNTDYPWYNNIQPVAWILDHHIQEGKRELNFSEFATYTPKKAAHKLDEVITETGEGAMPIASYLRMHKQASLSEEQRDLLTKWASDLADTIRLQHKLPIEH